MGIYTIASIRYVMVPMLRYDIVLDREDPSLSPKERVRLIFEH